MCDEDWVKGAMADDSLVVELLLRLHQARPPQPPPPPKKTAGPCLQLDWTVRQRRSRSAPRHVGAAADKKGEPTRASPTTPLSWSGATSASGGAAAVDGSEESSRPTKPMKTPRSKVANNNPSETTTTKRSRRKKTLAELKEEENQLLKERRNLKNELASLRLTVEKHRAANESLKRMKLDLDSRQNLKTTTTSVASDKTMVDQPQLVEAQCHPSHSVLPTSVEHMVVDDVPPVPSANASSIAQEIENPETSFLLPDLNLPVDEDLSSISIHGLS